MSRMIDADAIKLEKGFFENIDNVPKFFEWLEKQPTIDAVEVVRCGECAYVNARREDIVRCEVHRMWHTPMWFCADGERMGEEDGVER